MTISIDQSIRIFKAEIISQDMRLPRRRAEPLLEACACLKLRFKSRKNVAAILGMAEGVTLYLGKRGMEDDPDCLDFLKEALAHVVNIYEEGKFDPEREEYLGQRMYKRFTALKTSLKERRRGGDIPSSRATQSERAESGTTGGLSPETRGTQAGQEEHKAAAKARPRNYMPQQGDHFLLFKIKNSLLLIPRVAIALVVEVKSRQRSIYIASSQIPLREFSPLIGSLARRFQGPLGQISGSQLKKLHLPLIIPKGGSLPLLPDEHARHLVVLSHTQWHGAVLASLEADKTLILADFQAAANGDIAGVGVMDNGEKGESKEELPQHSLLNYRSLLEREGFIVSVQPNNKE